MTALPIVIGTARVHAKLLEVSGFNVTFVNPGGGKGIFGGKGQEATYSANVKAAFAKGVCGGILSIWESGGALENQSTTQTYTVPSGGGTFTAPQRAVDLGVTTQQAYSVTTQDHGATAPVTLSGTQSVGLIRATSPLLALQYSFNGTNSWTFPAAAAGQTVAITYSCQFSLYYLDATEAYQVPLSGPYQISVQNQQYFSKDLGVTFVDSGQPCTDYSLVSGTNSNTGNAVGGVYQFTSADAGRLVYIKYQYTSSDTLLDSSSVLNMTLYNGALGQPSPGGSALGYSGVCYGDFLPMAFGESAEMPAYNYEIVGQGQAPGRMDADTTQAMRIVLADANFPSSAIGNFGLAQNYWGAHGYFISQNLTSQQSASDILKGWLDAGNVGPVWSGSALNLIPYGDQATVGNGYTYLPPGPVATLTWDDLLPLQDKKTGEKSSDDPFEVTRAHARDAYNYMQASWTDRTNSYASAPIEAQNDAYIQKYGQRMEGPQNWPWITSQAVATWALNLRLKRSIYKRNTYNFALSFRWTALEPMDLIIFPTGETIRITEIEDDADGRREVTAEQWTYGSGSASIYPKQQTDSYQPSASQAVPGSTSAVIFEATPQYVLGQANTIQIALAGASENWGGCEIHVSDDGQTYTKLDDVIGGHTHGLMSAALPASSGTSGTLSVDLTLSGGELSSATQSAADQFATLCALVDASGSIELVSYETADLTAANRYNLTYLRRGVYGTAVGAHSIGAEFTYLGTGGVYQYQYPAQYVGEMLYFKFPAFNLLQGQLQDLSACKVYTFVIPGTTLQPPSSGTFVTTPANPLGTFANSSTDARITVSAFTASLNNLSVSCLPNGWTSAALTPGTNYYLYYVDYAFAGGDITPVVTQNPDDYLGKTGYYFLGVVQTATAGTTSGGTTTPGNPGGSYTPTQGGSHPVLTYQGPNNN